MKGNTNCSRRLFLNSLLAASATGAAWRAAAAEKELAFTPVDNEFHFDTGALRGTLHGQGRSRGLVPAFDGPSGTALTKGFGLFSHYRLLDDRTRYGTAAWDWSSQARVLSNRAVEVNWSADDAHSFDLQAVYRWSAPSTLDLTTRVTARGALRRFEVFLASYFDGFPLTRVYANDPANGGTPAFLAASKSIGTWHMFPRDEEAVKLIQDGRWQRPPHPVEWAIRPALAIPLAVRRDPSRGLAAVLMTRAADCFAVAAPHDEEGHRSVYFSLFGRDLGNRESATAHSRLIIGRGITDQQAVAMYEAFAG